MVTNKLIKILKSGKIIIKKSTYRMVPAFEISRTGKPTDKESRFWWFKVRGGGQGGGGGNNCEVVGTSFGGDENVLKLNVVVVTFVNILRTSALYTQMRELYGM